MTTEKLLPPRVAIEWLHQTLPGRSLRYWRHLLSNGRELGPNSTQFIPSTKVGAIYKYRLSDLHAFATVRRARAQVVQAAPSIVQSAPPAATPASEQSFRTALVLFDTYCALVAPLIKLAPVAGFENAGTARFAGAQRLFVHEPETGNVLMCGPDDAVAARLHMKVLGEAAEPRAPLRIVS